MVSNISTPLALTELTKTAARDRAILGFTFRSSEAHAGTS